MDKGQLWPLLVIVRVEWVYHVYSEETWNVEHTKVSFAQRCQRSSSRPEYSDIVSASWPNNSLSKVLIAESKIGYHNDSLCHQVRVVLLL